MERYYNTYFNNLLNEIKNSKLDINIRELKNQEEKIAILYVEQLTDKIMIANELVKPINIYIRRKDLEIFAQEASDFIIYSSTCFIDYKEEKIIEYVLLGLTVVLFSNDKEYIVVDLKSVEKRATNSPDLTYTLRGPRDSFVENLDANLSLVRYRIKDPKLSINKFELGRRTKTAIAILYIADIANESIVEDLTSRIRKIDVDGIISSGEIQRLILNKRLNLFPQMGVIERSDMAAAALLEGKIIVLVEGSILALVAPKVFSEFFASCDDYYDDKYIAILAKYVRLYSSLLSVTITAMYVAILSFHIDTLPGDFIFTIYDSTQGVPFSVFVGAFIIEMIVEMLREALLRVPSKIGSAVGIVGGIVIGQSAIAAKIFSPLLLIVAAISLLTSFTVPDYTIMNSLRIIKFLLIFASGLFGLVGFTLAISILLINMVSVSTFGIPYLAPFAPFNWYDFKNTFFYGKDVSPYRANFLGTKDNTRINRKKNK